ncbi:MAG TPA: YbaB/EbfC family nucleoid-associated protein [Phycisphaerae bacterium]|nr:YbaB/EbfC family nucleoid-associated protein [Phycisphaerae bacterium]
MGGLGDLLGLMRNAGAMKQKMKETQESLAQQTVEGSAGDPGPNPNGAGGAGAPGVVATANGMQELVDLKIAPEIVNSGDVELLEDMVRSAVSQALAKARELQRAEMSKLLGGLPLPPGLSDLLA